MAQTQFGKRLLLLPCVEASEIIPAEEDDDNEYIERGVSRDPKATTRALDQEEKEDAQWIERKAYELCELIETHRRGPRTEGDLEPGGRGPGKWSAGSWRRPGSPWWG